MEWLDFDSVHLNHFYLSFSLTFQFLRYPFKTRTPHLLENLCFSGHGYWLGGFNFNNDSDLEWISKPNENMPYAFWVPNEPNNPFIKNCLMAFKHRNFKWVDGYCRWKGAYICEFKYVSK